MVTKPTKKTPQYRKYWGVLWLCATLTLSILFWLKYNTMSQIIQVYSLLYKILYKLSIIAYKCTKCTVVTSVELFTLNNDSLGSHYFNDPRTFRYARYLNYRNGSRDINRHAPKKDAVSIYPKTRGHWDGDAQI